MSSCNLFAFFVQTIARYSQKHSTFVIFSTFFTKTEIKIGSFIFYLYFCTVFQEKTLCQRKKY